MKMCQYLGCNIQYKTYNNYSFFKAPKNKRIAEVWYRHSGESDNKYFFLCERHFHANDMKKIGSRKLVKNYAVPKPCPKSTCMCTEDGYIDPICRNDIMASDRVLDDEYPNEREIRQHQEYELDLDEESNMHYPEIIFDVDDSSDSFKPQNDIGELRRRQEAIRNHANNMSLRNNRPSRIKTVLDDANSKFLADFDPETSAREKRKLSRKTFTAPAALGKNATMYDNKGIFRLTGEDLCDCLDGECPGCHFPCPNCNGPKCGSTCRGMRKWGFEQIEHDAKDLVIYNEYNKRQPMY